MTQPSDDQRRLSLPPVEEIADQVGVRQADADSVDADDRDIDPELEAMADHFVE